MGDGWLANRAGRFDSQATADGSPGLVSTILLVPRQRGEGINEMTSAHHSLVTGNWSLVTRHSSLVTRHSSLITHHSSLNDSDLSGHDPIEVLALEIPRGLRLDAAGLVSGPGHDLVLAGLVYLPQK